MKKIAIFLLIIMVSVLAFSHAYPVYGGYPDLDWHNNTNGDISLENEKVDVRIYQWLSADFISRAQFQSTRKVSVRKDGSTAPLSSFVLVDKPGVYENEILGIVPVVSNGDVSISVNLNKENISPSKINIHKMVTGLDIFTFNEEHNGALGYDLIYGTSIQDAFVANQSDYTKSYSNANKTVKIHGPGNTPVTASNAIGGVIYGPEFILTADLAVPINQTPGDNSYIAIDINVVPDVKF